MDDYAVDPAAAGSGGRLHDVLLRIAGQASDEVVAEARAWLADGRQVEVAQAIAFGAASHHVPMLKADIGVLAAVLTAGNEDSSILAELPVRQAEAVPDWAMAPFGPQTMGALGGAAPHVADLTGDRESAERPDEVDRAAVSAAVNCHGGTRLVGLWRAWRYPRESSLGVRPRRLYLLEAGSEIEGGALVSVAAEVQRALQAAGEANPQVEVFREAEDIPTYQRLAQGYGALLWAARSTGPIRVARVFDAVNAVTGPLFHRDHPILEEGDERNKIIEYLRAGAVLLATPACAKDVVDPSRGVVVPLSARTDGVWVWTDTVTYYLDAYGFAPDVDLLEHLADVGYAIPRVDSAALHRAIVELARPTSDEPVWNLA
jgi:hypothetical protein